MRLIVPVVWLLLFCVHVLVCQVLHAQPFVEGALLVQKFSLEQGLAQSMVTTARRDAMGLLWVGTAGGLHCFDGMSFAVYQSRRDRQAALPDNTVRTIHPLDSRQLLVSTSSAIGIFDTQHAAFHVLNEPTQSEPVVFDAVLGADQLCWTRDSGYMRVSKADVSRIHCVWRDGIKPPSTFVPHCGISDGTGYAVIGGVGGVIMLSEDHADSVMCTWLPMPNVHVLVAKGPDGVLFVAGEGKIWRCVGQRLLQQGIRIGLGELSAFFVDRDYVFWLADSDRSQLHQVTADMHKTVMLYTREGRFTETIKPYIKFIGQDHVGNVWMGTDGTGLLLHQPQRFDFDKYPIGFTCHIASSEHYVWAGTYKSGLWRITPETGKYEQIATNSLNRYAYAVHIHCDDKNRVWVASDNGLSVLTEEGTQLYAWKNRLSKPRLRQDHPDTIVLSSSDGILRYFSATANIGFRREQREAYFSTSTLHSESWWIGNAQGLYKGPVPSVADCEQLSSDQVNAIIGLDSDVWVGSADGIAVYGDDGVMHHRFNYPENLPGNKVYGLLADRLGCVWFSGDHGIGCVFPDNRVQVFGIGYNLQSLEFVSGAAHRHGDRLYFGGVEGLNGFTPETYHRTAGTTNRGVPVLTRVMLKDSVLVAGVPAQDGRYKIAAGDGRISGAVGSANYEFPHLQHFSFLLKDHDAYWSHPQASRTFVYDNLPPGTYELLAKYRDAYGNWSQAASLLYLTVTPQFHQTWWFRLLFVLASAGCVAYLAKTYQRRRYAKIVATLEQKDTVNQERLRIARDLHDEVGAELSHIALLARNAGSVSDKKDKVLDEIAAKSREVIDNLRYVIWVADPRHDTIEDLRAVIREYVSDFAERAGWSCRFVGNPDDEFHQLSSVAKRNLFLIIKECLHNTHKHTQAIGVVLSWEYREQELLIAYADDGRGVGTRQRSGALHGRGLENMRKRADEIGGRVTVSPGSDDQGVEVCIGIPLHPPKNSP